MRRAAAGIAIAAALSQLAACSLRTTAPPGSVAPHVSTLIAALASREQSLHSMRSGAVMDFKAADGRHFSTHEQIALTRPSSIRVEAMAPFGVAMVLTADHAGQLMIFDPHKNTLLSGRANAATMARFVGIPMAPPALVDLLMGLAPDPSQLGVPPDAVTNEENMTVVRWRLGNGAERSLGFLGRELRMVRERDASGARRYEVRYFDWRYAGAMKFPHKIEVTFPSTRITLRYETPALNQSMPQSIFVLNPGPATKRISIGAGSNAGPGTGG